MSLAVICPSCGKTADVPDSFVGRKIRCPKCKGNFVAERPPAVPPPRRPAVDLEEPIEEAALSFRQDSREPDNSGVPRPPRKYTALRIIAVILRICAAFDFIAGAAVITLYLSAAMAAPSDARGVAVAGFFPAFGLFVGLIFAGIFQLAAGETIKVFLDTEENTRWQCMLLRELLRQRPGK